MAGDWIAMQTALWDAPEVLKMSLALLGAGRHSAEARAAAKCQVVGALFRLWSIFDSQTVDGTLDGYDADTVDSVVGMPGFAMNLQHVGWLVVNEQSITMPAFDRWLGQSAKRRIQATERKRKERTDGDPVTLLSRSCHASSVTHSDTNAQSVSRSSCDKNATREEKRTEELNTESTKVDSSAEPEMNSGQQPMNGSGMKFQLSKGGQWELPASKLRAYESTYGDRVDVGHELSKATIWLDDNATKRPRSGRGMQKFLTSWMNSADDRARRSQSIHGPPRPKAQQVARPLRPEELASWSPRGLE